MLTKILFALFELEGGRGRGSADHYLGQGQMRNWKRIYNPPPKKFDLFFHKCFNIWTKKIPIFFSKVLKFTWKMWNRLNRKKNPISDFSDLYFSSYGYFWSFLYPNLFCTPVITRKIDISFISAHIASFMKIEPFLRGVCISSIRGLHILTWDRALITIGP